MRFKFSSNINIIGGILISLMLLASHWQWRRHNYKQELIKQMELRLNQAPSEIKDLLSDIKGKPETVIHRRVIISGEYDFSKEIYLRNRRLGNDPGVFLITPLKIDGSSEYILVNRGFIPLKEASKEARAKYQINPRTSFIGLIKATQAAKLFAPQDPDPSQTKSWVDGWLRVDLEKMQKQLPFQILPIHLEIMHTDINATSAEITKSSSAKADMLILPLKGLLQKDDSKLKREYPVIVYDTVVPAGRHFGYVFEWASMALMTFLICLVLQFKRHS